MQVQSFLSVANRFTEKFEEVQPSLFRPGQVDLPVVALEWLRRFKTQNSTFLEDNEVLFYFIPVRSMMHVKCFVMANKCAFQSVYTKNI